jgi:UDP-GlcNAc:undecaprenyl-phosphate GlcNAc-1-phosphate transferase
MADFSHIFMARRLFMLSSRLLTLLLGTLVPSLVMSWCATWIMRHFAPRWGLVDQPGERKVHSTPMPLGGGLAIWCGVLLPLAVGQLIVWLLAQGVWPEAWLPELVREHRAGLTQQLPKLWLLLAAGTSLVILGLLDDLRHLSWQFRLSTQVAVAAVCVLLVEDVCLTLFLPWPWITGLLSVLWIVTLINSFNMLDNMDGLATGVAAITAGLLATVLLMAPDPHTQQPQWFVAALLLVMTGSFLGFLGHNFPAAKIFMGDAGSYGVGFLLATTTLLATYAGYHQEQRHALLAPLCIFAVPLYDMTTVIAIRLANGKSPFVGDKNHFSHRLVDLGLSKTQAVLTIHLLTATCGLGGIVLHQLNRWGAVLILVLIACVLSVIAIIETAAREHQRRVAASGKR